MTSQQPERTSTQIMDMIKERAVIMRPKWHFVLRGVLFIVGLAILFVTLLYIVSFTLFSLRESGVLFAPEFGFRGWYIFLISLPWLLIALAISFIIILELLVRHYAFAYRQPLMYSLFGILVVVFVGGVIVNRTELHPQLLRFVDERQVPLAREWYQGYGHRRLKQVHTGQVTDVQETGCGMKDIRGEDLSVRITPKTRMPYGTQLIIGDHIVVVGERIDDTIQAFGIRKVVPARLPEQYLTR